LHNRRNNIKYKNKGIKGENKSMNLIKKINYDDEGIYDVSYFNNGREISFEDYIRIENALEEDFEDDYDECDGDCENCEFEECTYDGENGLEQPCNCADCMIDRYVEEISDLGLICPHYAREVLVSFYDEVFRRIME
jgi:hypothetical protein